MRASMKPLQTPSRDGTRRLVERAAVLLVLAGAFLLRLRRLGHPSLTLWDEAYHAVVARNLTHHWLRPTLYDVPYLPANPTNWNEASVWLHKPILALWQMAASLALFGPSTFALRLPSLLLATGTVLLTYLIGRRLFDHRAGLAAALVVALSPIMTELVHGHLFADHVDIALIFWCTFGVYFLVRALQSGSFLEAAIAGAATGLGHLAKSHLALFVAGLALVAWLLPRLRIAQLERSRWHLGHLGIFALTGLAIGLPWELFAAQRYPVEYHHELEYVARHVTESIEGWGGPTSRLAFDYLPYLHRNALPLAIAGMLALLWVAVRRRAGSAWLMLAWTLGILVPVSVAVTKTPTSSVVALPAIALLVGALIGLAFAGSRMALALWVGTAGAAFVWRPALTAFGRGAWTWTEGYAQARWVVLLPLAGLVLAIAVALAGPLLERMGARLRTWSRRLLLTFALATTLWAGVEHARASWAVTARDPTDRGFAALAETLENELPANAVLLLVGGGEGDSMRLMFHADRVTYAVAEANLDGLSKIVHERGGVPFVVSRGVRTLELVAESAPHRVYRWAAAGAP